MSLLNFGRSDPRWLVLILVLTTLAAVALALVAWFLLPLIAIGGFEPFASDAARLAAILTIAVVWGTLNALLRAGRNSADQARLDTLDKQEQETRAQHDEIDLSREAAFVRIRQDARRALRRRAWRDRLLGRHGAEPRYLVVGPTGAGKTTALTCADLNLPFAARGGASASSDPGCRFIPSEGALYVDVAGDLLFGARPEWVGLWARFLDLLRAARPARPVDGVILVLAATDLAGLDEEARTELARSLRTLLDEIAHRLRVSVPVFILLSKADRILGFREFFETLGAEERAQIWGVPVAAPDGTDATADTAGARFGYAFDDLVRRAVARQLKLLHAEPDEQRRMLAFEFPAQLAILRDRVAGFLTQLARQNQIDGAPRLRGVFLASACQDGAAIDAIDEAMARTFAFRGHGHVRSTAGSGLAGQTRRAYFLERLLGDVIPAEAGGVHLSARARLATQVRAYGVRAVAIGALAGAALLIWGTYRDADTYLDQVLVKAEVTQRDLGRRAADPGARDRVSNLPLTLAVLDDFAGVKAAAAAPAPETFVDVTEMRGTASGAYAASLRILLVPLLLRSLEAQLTDADTSPAVRFESLKLYLLLGEGRPIPASLLADLGPMLAASWFDLGADAGALQRAMIQIAALSDTAPSAHPIDAGLVAQTRRRLASVTVAQIGYEILRQQPAVRALQPWRPIDHAGGLGPRVIARTSGAALSVGIPGLFTAAGLQEMSVAVRGLAETFATDAWVFGPDAAGQPNLTAQAIQSGMLDLYRADYVRAWEALLTDLTVPPLPTATAATDLFAILYGANPPIQQLLAAVVSETSLDREVSDAVLQGMSVQAKTSPLATSVSASPIAAALLPKVPRLNLTTGPRQLIARQFAGLREAVTRPKDGQDSDVETALKSLDPLYRQLLLVASGAPQTDGPAAGANPALVQMAMNRLPVSIRPYFARLTTDATALIKYDVRGRAAQAWATAIRPVCRAIVTKAFPFDLRGNHEVTLAEFTQLFAPNGLIAGFRRTQLANLVDFGARPWRWRDGRLQPSDRPDPTLAMFERADAITAAFFPEGDRPQIRFTLEPARLDSKAESVQLDIGGASLRYAHGPEVPFAGQWPPPVADAPATLSLRPELDGAPNALVGEGPWGLFRLVAQGRFAPAGDGLLLAFDVGGRRATFKVSAATLRNPFDLRQLTGFSCPEF